LVPDESFDRVEEREVEPVSSAEDDGVDVFEFFAIGENDGTVVV